MRGNPKYFTTIFEPKKLHEQRFWGFTFDEMYPHFISNEPLGNVDAINEWLNQNRDLLPQEIKSIDFRDVHLLIMLSNYYQTVTWYLYHTPTDLILGSGLLGVSEDGGYFDVVSAGLDFQGFGMYPSILRKLKQELGPLRSDRSLSLNALKVWKSLGARFVDKRWIFE